jgi:hypothetical protein
MIFTPPPYTFYKYCIPRLPGNVNDPLRRPDAIRRSFRQRRRDSALPAGEIIFLLFVYFLIKVLAVYIIIGKGVKTRYLRQIAKRPWP